MTNILAIDTSCDETAVAIVSGRRVISNVIYSQTLMHNTWGGVVPSLAKRAHQEKIDPVIQRALKRASMTMQEIDAIAVTYGPGLAIALEVGINKAKDLAAEHNKPLIGIDHMEGHLYSSFVQNSQGNPKREFEFPYLVLLVSGGHTDLVLFKNHLQYEILGSKRDDAAGEALDKAGRLLGFGYPGAPTMERLSEQVENADKYKFPRPMIRSGDLDFSFAGLKTAFLYFVKKLPEEEKVENLNYLASSFQEAVFQTLVSKTKDAIIQTGVKSVLLGGGVSVNKRLRTLMKRMVKEQGGSVYFPSYKYLNFDNAAMIGVAASFRAERKLFVKDLSELDRKPRLSLKDSSVNPIV